MNQKIRFGDAERNDLALVRQVVLCRLANEPGWRAAENSDQGYRKYVDFAEHRHFLRFMELAETVLWELIGLGVILPGSGGGSSVTNFCLPSFRVTAYGQEVLRAGRIVPHDPDGFIAEVKNDR